MLRLVILFWLVSICGWADEDNTAQKLFSAKRYQESSQAFRKLLNSEPENPAWRYGLARSEYAQGLVTKAVLYCLPVSSEPFASKCRQLEANAEARYSGQTELARAMFEVSKNRLSAAREILLGLDRTLVLEPDFHAILAHYWFRVGSYTQALQSARFALESEKLSISLSRLMRLLQEKYGQCAVSATSAPRKFFPLELDLEFCTQWELGLKDSETSANITLDSLIELAGGKALYDAIALKALGSEEILQGLTKEQFVREYDAYIKRWRSAQSDEEMNQIKEEILYRYGNVLTDSVSRRKLRDFVRSQDGKSLRKSLR